MQKMRDDNAVASRDEHGREAEASAIAGALSPRASDLLQGLV